MGPIHTLLSQNMSYLYSIQYSMSIYLSNLSNFSIPLTHRFGTNVAATANLVLIAIMYVMCSMIGMGSNEDDYR